MAQLINSFKDQIANSPYRNIYWFARFLLNSDQYGAIGKNKESELLELSTRIESIVVSNTLPEKDRVITGKALISTTLDNFISRTKGKSSAQIAALKQKLDESILSIMDLAVFYITVKHVTTPANKILESIPSRDDLYAKQVAKKILDEGGETKVGLALHQWDLIGSTGCIEEERALIVEGFDTLIKELKQLKVEHSELDDQLILTAFIQELERRAAQKRKSRGGRSLESTVDFLFHYFKFKSSDAPSHFDQDFEVDKWFKCDRGWLIGISMKRTLRERWKQINVSLDVMHKFKIREVWHICTYDNDLSDDKVVNLGSKGHIFYLWEESEKYKELSKDQSMSIYVRPLCQLIQDIRERQN